MAETGDVISKGIVDATPPSKAKASTAPANTEPGQIVFSVRPFTFFEKLLYPLLKP